MIRAAFALAFIFAAACLLGAIDRNSSEVTHRAAMEAPRPIFEPVHDLRRLSMPCTYISTAAAHQPITAQNTRCVKADRSDK